MKTNPPCRPQLFWSHKISQTKQNISVLLSDQSQGVTNYKIYYASSDTENDAIPCTGFFVSKEQVVQVVCALYYFSSS